MNSEILGQALCGLANTIESQVKKAMDLVFEKSSGEMARNDAPNQFKNLKTYVFNFENFKKNMESQWQWTKEADGMAVDKLLNCKNAILKNGYVVKPEWCKEIKEAK